MSRKMKLKVKDAIEKAIGRKLKENEPVFRSCWECNGCHKHLKKMIDKHVLYCFVCGTVYYKKVMLKLYES